MQTRLKVLVVGCSMTKGHGLKYESSDPELWVNKLFPCDKYEVINKSKSGINNHWIFLETIFHLLTETYDIVLVGWSAIPRFNFKVGLELYSTHTMLASTDDNINLNNNTTISGKWLKSIGDNLKKIHNDHWDFLDLVKYVNVLILLQTKSRHGHIFFINGLGPWPDQYFLRKQINLPSDLTIFEQTMFQVDCRDDLEIFQLYNMVHEQYNKYGGIQENHWLNLYQSQDNLKVDTISSTDSHPGCASQEIFSEYFYQQLQKISV